MDEPKTAWSSDEEVFNYDSLGELIDGCIGEIGPGDTVYFGECVYPEARELCNADDVIDLITDRASDIGGEFADGYPDVTREERQELEDFLLAWISKRCPPTFYTMRNVKQRVLVASDFEGRG